MVLSLDDFIYYHLDFVNNLKYVFDYLLPEKYKKFINRYFYLYHIFNINNSDLNISKQIAKFVIKQEPDNIIFITLLADNYYYNNDQYHAEKYLHKGLKIDPNFIFLKYQKFKIYKKYYDFQIELYLILKDILNDNHRDIFALYNIINIEKDINILDCINHIKELLNLTPYEQEIAKTILNLEESVTVCMKQILYKIDRKEYMKIFYNKENYYEDRCSVCLCDLKQLNIVKLICGHFFHIYCVYKVKKCPICREKILFVKDNSEIDLYTIIEDENVDEDQEDQEEQEVQDQEEQEEQDEIE